MKKMKWLLCGLSAVMAFSSIGCKSNEVQDSESVQNENTASYVKSEVRTPEDVYSLSFDIIGGQDVMPIGAWWGPYINSMQVVNGNRLPNYNQDKYFKLMKEAGLNMVSVTPNDLVYTNYHDPIMEALDLSEKYDLAYFVHDSKFRTYSSSDAQLQRIIEWINHPACVGIHMKDEPQIEEFDSIALQYELFKELGFEDKILYTNLYPSYAGFRFSSTKSVTFEEYVRTFLEKVDTPFLCTDHYPFNEKDEGTDNKFEMFREFSTLRTISAEYKIPFWGFVQAGGQWADGGQEFYSEPIYPSEGEFIWNVNLLLAYGCKAIQYFTFLQPQKYYFEPDDGADFNRNGMLGAAGNKNTWYYYAQKANKQVAAVDHVLMNARSMGVIPVGEKPNQLVCEAEKIATFRELTSVEGTNALIGCFDYFGKTALYVVNNSTVEKQKVTLNFSDNYGYEVIQRAVSVETGGKSVTLTLEKGEGVLVVLQ